MLSSEQIKSLLIRIEDVGLGLIVLATIVALGQEAWDMVLKARVDLADLLLLFIYLEVIAMVSIYFECHQLPVRIPLFIAIVALARYLILNAKTLGWEGLLATSGAILILAVGVLVIQLSQVKFPYRDN